MNELNEYIKENFDKLQLNHQNFVPASVSRNSKGGQMPEGMVHPKYRLGFFRFGPFYKPITTYLK